jgi:hypothetical protein
MTVLTERAPLLPPLSSGCDPPTAPDLGSDDITMPPSPVYGRVAVLTHGTGILLRRPSVHPATDHAGLRSVALRDGHWSCRRLIAFLIVIKTNLIMLKTSKNRMRDPLD